MRSFAVLSTLALVLALALPACTTRVVSPGRDTGTTTMTGTDTGTFDPFHDANHPDTGVHSSGCSSASQLIYLVDSNNSFISYDPGTSTFTNIGTLNCAPVATPFSMAVSRDAVAYVLYSNHKVYAVSTSDASCSPTPWVMNQMGFEEFGMGFVSDVAGGTAETLYIAGGSATGIGSGSSTLGRIDVSAWSVSTIGALDGSPELTGNGLAELWGFFPDTQPMAVRQLDRDTGARVQEWDVSSINTGGGGRAQAWAFAYWGGRYYMFYQGPGASSTGIYTLTPDTNEVVPVMTNTGRHIVGAGVSTCAPTILI